MRNIYMSDTEIVTRLQSLITAIRARNGRTGSRNSSRVDRFYEVLPLDPFTRQEALSLEHAVATVTVDRWLATLRREGKLRLISHGVYEKILSGAIDSPSAPMLASSFGIKEDEHGLQQ